MSAPVEVSACELSHRRWPLWLGALAVCLLMAADSSYTLPDASGRLAALLHRGLTYSSQEVSFTHDEEVFLGGALGIKRLYHISGQGDVLLLAIDGTHNRHAVHDPAFCFRGAGYHIIRSERIPLPGGSARLLILRNAHNEQREALYWFTNGHTRSPSLVWQIFESAWYRLTLGKGTNPPILVLLSPASPNTCLDWSRIVTHLPPLLKL